MCVNLHIKILSFFQQLACYPHPRSSTVSLETFILYSSTLASLSDTILYCRTLELLSLIFLNLILGTKG